MKKIDIPKKEVPEVKEDNVIRSMLHGIVNHEYKVHNDIGYGTTALIN